MRLLTRWYRRARYGRPVVVVSGLPRSGTSLMMQMLHAGGVEILTDGLRSADQSNPRGYYEFEPVKDMGRSSDLSWLAGAGGKAVKIISSLLKHLPPDRNYAVILMTRELAEVIASQDKMLAARGEAVPETDRAALARTYGDHLRHVRTLLAREDCFDTLEVQYRDVVDQPRREAERVVQFLGLDNGAVPRMAAAADATLYRNRADRPDPWAQLH
jgi:Sulfotransferase family